MDASDKVMCASVKSVDLGFSIVMPVKCEVDLLRRSLPSCYRVSPEEVIVCLDDPPHERTVEQVKEIAETCGWADRTRILLVARNPEYPFHQAWVRREGFRRAKHDRILTVDVDLLINRNVIKAVSLVGRENIGMVSCATLHSVGGYLGLWRAMSLRFTSYFSSPALTGLYAIWRPYWLDSEDERVKLLENPKAQAAKGSLVLIGEDAYLRNCMKTKHRCIHLRDLGAYCMRGDCNDDRHIQFELGRYYAEQARSVVVVFARALAFGRPHLLRGYIYQMRVRKKIPTPNPETYPY